MNFHPGYYLREILMETDLDISAISAKVLIPIETIEEIMNEEKDIDKNLAEKLATGFGTSVNLWLNLQKKYNKEKRHK